MGDRTFLRTKDSTMAKKTSKKTTKKASKKVTKKTTKKTTKKAAKKAPKKSPKKTTRTAAAPSPSVPTMEVPEPREDFYSPPPTDYAVGRDMSADMSRPEEGESSSRKVIWFVLILVVLVVAVAVVLKIRSDGPGTTVVDTGKVAGGEKTTKKKPPDVKPVEKYRIHVVKKGDTLSNIARRYGVRDWRSIMKLNKLPNARAAKLGMKLKIPGKK